MITITQKRDMKQHTPSECEASSSRVTFDIAFIKWKFIALYFCTEFNTQD